MEDEIKYTPAYIILISIIIILLILLYYFITEPRGMKFYGPHQWSSLHAKIAKYDPNTQKKSMEQYLNSLKELLPCEKCRIHYKQNLNNRPFEPYLNDREALFHWSYQLHDDVNKQLNKKSPSYSKIKKYYEHKMKVKI